MHILVTSKGKYYYIEVSENGEIYLQLAVEKCHGVDVFELAKMEEDGTFHFEKGEN